MLSRSTILMYATVVPGFLLLHGRAVNCGPVCRSYDLFRCVQRGQVCQRGQKTGALTLVRQAAIELGSAFRQAAFAETLNPKTAAFFLAFLLQFVRSADCAVGLRLAVQQR